MRVTLLFFAAARDATGCARAEPELPDEVVTVGDLVLWLSRQYPTLAPYTPCLRIAQNEQFAGPASLIHSGDVLAVIPPVAGG